MGATEISIAQAKSEFADLVARAEAGEEIVFTRKGKPVARLTGLSEKPADHDDLAELGIDEGLALSKSIIHAFMAR